MLIVYDETGKIITKDTKKEEIKGSLYFIEIEVPEGKVLNRVDTNVLPHVAVFVDKPKTEVELTQEQIQKLIPQLLGMDILQGTNIKELKDLTKTLEFKVNQLETKVGVK